MCRATLGATPVNRCTWAASAIFSCGVRGTPGWANTLNRVPELPNAHDGSLDPLRPSGRPSRRSGQACQVLISRRQVRRRQLPAVPVQVEYLVEPPETLVRAAPPRSTKNSAISACQRALTSVRRHRCLGGRVVLGLQVADEQAVVGQEERVVVPAGGAQRARASPATRRRAAARYSSSRSGRTRPQEADAVQRVPPRGWLEPGRRDHGDSASARLGAQSRQRSRDHARPDG